MPELRQAGDVVDLDYPPFFIDPEEDAVPLRPQAPQIRRPARARLRQPRPSASRPTAPQSAATPLRGRKHGVGVAERRRRSGIPFRLTLQQAALVSAPAADIHVCENPAAPALS
jgi:hypothetical protein